MEKTLDTGEQSTSRLGSDSRSTTYGGGSSGCSVTPLPCGTVSACCWLPMQSTERQDGGLVCARLKLSLHPVGTLCDSTEHRCGGHCSVSLATLRRGV